MVVENKTSYNDAFWSYLNHQLKVEFARTKYSYRWMYPIEISIDSLFKKRKTNEKVTINARVLFEEDGDEKEYLGKLTLGSYSRKAYTNVKGIDLTKCYPKSDFSEWVKMDELNNVVEIYLK
ncbi:hypothetical protein POV27_04075 [Aureisphaera galaxeae]|nr:hypothetical protein [Aureisphaera galaxeae]